MTEANPQQVPVKMRIVRSGTTPTIYVEGVTQMMVGFPNSRLQLSGMVDRAGNGASQEDVHLLACELVMPTSAMIEIAQGILQNLAQNKAMLQQGSAEWIAKAQEVFDLLTPAADPKADT